MRPFSNGTEAMMWYSHNCEDCKRAFFPGQDAADNPHDYPCDQTMLRYVRLGKECKLKYFIDLAFMSGEIPVPIAEEIGYNAQTSRFPFDCKRFSDDDEGYHRPPVEPKGPPPGDIRQLHIFPLFNEFLPQEKNPVLTPDSAPMPA